MFEPGDLIKISDDCDLHYFKGQLAIIVSNFGQDITDHAKGYYYKVKLTNGSNHIFYEQELVLLSKAANHESK